jgi:hypothetical protein
MLQHEDQLRTLLQADGWRMAVMKAVRDFGLNDCWTGAGFIRSYVWDYLNGLPPLVPEDVDVIYYAPDDISESTEKALDRRLAEAMPDVPWSCKNQARMHLKAGLQTPYADTADGLRHWTETATAVAARVNDNDGVEILAPFGLNDLFEQSVRPTPFFRQGRMEQYRARLAAKNWQQRWPSLTFIED